MLFQNQALLFSSLYVLFFHACSTLAFLTAPQTNNGLHSVTSINDSPTKMHSSVFDMPSREKEDEEVGKRKFRLSNIVGRRKYDSPAGAVKKNEQITQVHNLEEYKTHVADVTDAMVVVFFTAPWCRTCARLKPKMKAMAAGLSKVDNVKLVQIPLLDKEGAALFKGLGVKSFPFAHIYHPEAGLVEELKLNRKLWSEFQKTLKEYLEGSCELHYNKDGDIRQELRIVKP
mmetsp:Transcript_32456/g.78803  ORF Transcript_32456/g.78803 Transcript_32456/m.78803 type:complete len:230 (+) Transcript_32456:127-816(+)|eukprot:CAMPEP_0113620710 /NCGR_PEP_ID=MMETSP0017_2-20120614/10560_1 /TAXON_ID=2856 /ORGANISM="Cylindrotheca closterium" /LENGTH=229 /DNA_ID=CAMNT_0000530393 /DNA_START=127 /DNA_END=816 /DNA_ORIENTATION=+ /assembly_acc=CAM_ASM_000147